MKIGDIAHRSQTWVGMTALVFLLSLLLVPSSGCGPKGELLLEQEVIATEGASITSADGNIALEIPPEALLKDTKITVRIVPEEEWTDDIQALRPAGRVYSLEPDGLEFNEPVEVTVRLDSEDLASLGLENAYPVLLPLTISDDGGLDLLGNPTMKVDIDTGVIQVSGDAVHFSDAAVASCIEFSLEASINPKEETAAPNQNWPVTVTVTNNSPRDSVTIDRVEFFGKPEGKIEEILFGGESPGFVLPPKASKDIETRFQCYEPCGGSYHASVVLFYYQGTLVEAFKVMMGLKKPPPMSFVRDDPNYWIQMDVHGSVKCAIPQTLLPPPPPPPTTPEPVEEPTVVLSQGNARVGLVDITADIEWTPLSDWELTLDGPSVYKPSPTQSGTLDADGRGQAVWQVNASGDFSVSGTVNQHAIRRAWITARILFCFAGDTLVLMADNSFKRISDMQVGDMVQAYDAETGQTLIADVTATSNGEADYYYLINGNLKVTPPHPFFTAEGQWVKIADLKVGDKIRNIQGQVEITSIEKVNSGQRIYNISVRDFHNFFVSANGKDFYLVHEGLPEDR